MSDSINTVVKTFTQNERETNMNHGTYLYTQTAYTETERETEKREEYADEKKYL